MPRGRPSNILSLAFPHLRVASSELSENEESLVFGYALGISGTYTALVASQPPDTPAWKVTQGTASLHCDFSALDNAHKYCWSRPFPPLKAHGRSERRLYGYEKQYTLMGKPIYIDRIIHSKFSQGEDNEAAEAEVINSETLWRSNLHYDAQCL